ncbi:MAG: phosphatidate cytidylyltransferase [Flavobacteriaceae bacterium]|nr:phosphatidate cytidylyltransferase [Flavobacteriaceae bacterium]
MTKEGKFADVPLRVRTWCYIIVVFAIALLHPLTLLAFILFLLYWGQRELYTIAMPKVQERNILPILNAFVIGTSIYLLPFSTSILLISGYAILLHLILYLRHKAYLFFLLISTCYLIAMPILYYIGNGEMGYKYLILLVVPMELNDVSQYMAGKLFGKTKITPTISPNKTLEGVIGGIIMTTGIFNLLYYLLFAEPITLKTILLAMVLSLLGFLGDLTFSLTKRKANVKDTGTLLPGHGGLLDRVDSLLYTTPLFYIVMLWMN